MRKLRALCGVLLLLPMMVTAAELNARAGQWLTTNAQWRVGVLLQAPYAQLKPRTGQLEGLNIDFTDTLAKHVGVALTWVAFTSQEALEAALLQGHVDVAVGQLQTPSGLKHWRYSDPYWRMAHLLVGDRQAEPRLDLKLLLRDQPVAVRLGDGLSTYLQSSYSNLTIRPYPSAREALRAVLAQRARFAALDQARLSALSQESEFAGIVVVGDVGLPQLLRFAAPKHATELIDILNYGLRVVPAGELEQLQARWLTARTPHWSDSAVVWRNVAIVGCVALLMLLVLMAELRRQRGALSVRLAGVRASLEQRDVADQELRLAQFSLDHSTVGILWLNWDSRVRYANQAVAQMLGYTPQAMLEQPLNKFDPSLVIDRWMSLWRRVRQQHEEAFSFESLCTRADGSTLPVGVSLSFLRYRQAEYLVVYLTDITEQRGAREALEESEARLKAIASNVPGLVFRLEQLSPHADPEFAFISEGSEQLVGYSSAQVMASDFGIRSLVHPGDRADYHRSQDAAIEQAQDWNWQGRILTRSAQVRWADIKASARRLDDQRVVWDGVVWDMTQNKLIELELAASRAQLRELSAHVESVREEEKARIAREVHDELGQVLTVLKLETSMCELAYGELDPGLQQRLNTMKKLIAQQFQLVRDVATALRPPILDAGICSAIEWQVKRFESRSGISCFVQVPECSPALPDSKAVGLFRVLQEALTNIMRHAQANTVGVTLELQEHRMKLRISDDGRGFDPGAQQGHSYGLVGMRERVLMLGGHLEIISQPAEGTTLLVEVGLDEEAIA